MVIQLLLGTLLRSESEWPKDEALPLTMVLYSKNKSKYKREKNPANPANQPIAEKLPKWHFLTHACNLNLDGVGVGANDLIWSVLRIVLSKLYL